MKHYLKRCETPILTRGRLQFPIVWLTCSGWLLIIR